MVQTPEFKEALKLDCERGRDGSVSGERAVQARGPALRSPAPMEEVSCHNLVLEILALGQRTGGSLRHSGQLVQSKQV